MNSRRSKRKAFPVMDIGASAGGLEAFRQMLEKWPVDTGMGYVFLQHLDPTQASQLTDLLSCATNVPVFEARQRMMVKSNHVYFIPPNKNLTSASHVLKLTPRARAQLHNLLVDPFLKSLAEKCGRHAIGVTVSFCHGETFGALKGRVPQEIVNRLRSGDAKLDIRRGPGDGTIVTHC